MSISVMKSKTLTCAGAVQTQPFGDVYTHGFVSNIDPVLTIKLYMNAEDDSDAENEMDLLPGKNFNWRNCKGFKQFSYKESTATAKIVFGVHN